MKNDYDLEFEASKYSIREDEDGEIKLILRISMQDKLSAIAIPVKKRLKIRVNIDDEEKEKPCRQTVKKGYDRLKAVRKAVKSGFDG